MLNDAVALGNLRVKQARDFGLFIEIALVTGLTERTACGRLGDAHHRSSVKTVFAADWPRDQEAEHEQDDGDDAPGEAGRGRGPRGRRPAIDMRLVYHVADGRARAAVCCSRSPRCSVATTARRRTRPTPAQPLRSRPRRLLHHRR